MGSIKGKGGTFAAAGERFQTCREERAGGWTEKDAKGETQVKEGMYKRTPA